MNKKLIILMLLLKAASNPCMASQKHYEQLMESMAEEAALPEEDLEEQEQQAQAAEAKQAQAAASPVQKPVTPAAQKPAPEQTKEVNLLDFMLKELWGIVGEYAEEFKKTMSLKTPEPIRSVGFDFKGDKAIALSGGKAIIWDTKTGKILHILDPNTLKPKQAGIAGFFKSILSSEKPLTFESAALNKDGTRALTIHRVSRLNHIISIWNAQTGSIMHTFPTHTSPVNVYEGPPTACFSPDGTKIAISRVAEFLEVVVHEVEDGSMISKFSTGLLPRLMHFSTDGTKIFCLYQHNFADIHETTTGRLISRIQPPERYTLVESISSDGNYALALNPETGDIEFYNITTDKWNTITRLAPLIGSQLAFSPDSTEFAIGGLIQEGDTAERRLFFGKIKPKLLLYAKNIKDYTNQREWGFEFSQDNKTMIIYTLYDIIVIDRSSGQELQRIPTADGRAHSLSSDGKILALWNPNNEAPDSRSIQLWSKTSLFPEEEKKQRAAGDIKEGATLQQQRVALANAFEELRAANEHLLDDNYRKVITDLLLKLRTFKEGQLNNAQGVLASMQKHFRVKQLLERIKREMASARAQERDISDRIHELIADDANDETIIATIKDEFAKREQEG